jgi:hypothetical protein
MGICVQASIGSGDVRCFADARVARTTSKGHTQNGRPFERHCRNVTRYRYLECAALSIADEA